MFAMARVCCIHIAHDETVSGHKNVRYNQEFDITEFAFNLVCTSI